MQMHAMMLTICFLLLLIFAPPSQAHLSIPAFPRSVQDSSRDSLFQRAEQSLLSGNIKGAEETFRNLLKVNDDARARVGLGSCLLVQEKWNDAREQFDRALELEPRNVAAQYFAGITYRELGRWRGPFVARGISQSGAYARANDLLTSVIREDSSYQEVLYQHSLLLKDQERYGEALQALCGQLRVKPLFPNGYTALRRLCLAALVEGRASELLAWMPKSFGYLDLYIRAEIARAEGKYSEAERLLTDLIQTSYKTPYQLAYLSLLRICTKEDKPQQLEDLYWRAIRQIRTVAGAALMLEDLKYILTPAEMAEYAGLPLEVKRDQFFAAVWNRRNPTLGSLSNPRLVDHYKRLVYAEEHYYLDRERYSFFYSNGRWPPNFEFQDIGSVYIRLGPPSEVQKASDADARSSVMVPGKLDGATTESWLYRPSDESPSMIFHFAGPEKSFSVGGLAQPVQPSVQTNLMLEASQEGNNVTPFSLDPVSLAPDLAFWDPNYFHLSIGGSAAQRAQERIVENALANWRALSTTERYIPPRKIETFDIPNTISTFRGKTGKTILEIGYAIPGMSLLKEAGDSVRMMKVETGFAVYDRRWRLIASDAETLLVSRQNPESQNQFRFRQVLVKPDTYYVGIYAKPAGLEFQGKSERTVLARDFALRDISASDIQLALEIRPDSMPSIFDKDGLLVVANPSNTFSILRPVYAYLQIYNPARDASGKMKLELNITLKAVKLTGGVLSGVLELFSAKKGDFVASEVERWNRDGSLAKYLALDVHRMEPGLYDLEITINDRLAVKNLSRSVRLVLYKPSFSQ